MPMPKEHPWRELVAGFWRASQFMRDRDVDVWIPYMMLLNNEESDRYLIKVSFRSCRDDLMFCSLRVKWFWCMSHE